VKKRTTQLSPIQEQLTLERFVDFGHRERPDNAATLQLQQTSLISTHEEALVQVHPAHRIARRGCFKLRLQIQQQLRIQTGQRLGSKLTQYAQLT
jgi:hypothetical protein